MYLVVSSHFTAVLCYQGGSSYCPMCTQTWFTINLMSLMKNHVQAFVNVILNCCVSVASLLEDNLVSIMMLWKFLTGSAEG